MTIGVLVNRCRAFRRDDVEREVKALVAAGALRAEPPQDRRQSEKYFAA